MPQQPLAPLRPLWLPLALLVTLLAWPLFGLPRALLAARRARRRLRSAHGPVVLDALPLAPSRRAP